MMKTRRVVVVAALAAVFLGTAASAVQLLEVGLRIDLGPHPVKLAGAVRWDFALGGFALVRFNEAWGGRASAGVSLADAGPYVSLGIGRTAVDNVILEGNVTYQWNARERNSTANFEAGVRFRSSPTSQQRSSLAVFPASWTLNTATGQRMSFTLSPNLSVDVGFAVDGGLVVGGAATVALLRVPSAADVPALGIGDGWMVSTRLTTHVGYAPGAL